MSANSHVRAYAVGKCHLKVSMSDFTSAGEVTTSFCAATLCRLRGHEVLFASNERLALARER